MPTIITEHTAASTAGQPRYWTYCGLDCTITREVWDTLTPRLTDTTRRIYKFQLGLQAPVMAMMLRGVKVDQAARIDGLAELERDHVEAVAEANRIVAGVWDGIEKETGQCPKAKRHKWPRAVHDSDKVCELCGTARLVASPFNPNSDPQCKRLLYKLLGVPEQHNREGKVSVDKDALERIAKKYVKAEAIALQIKLCRDLKKQISVLNTGLSDDGRMRSTFVVGGAWTGRFSSTKNPYKQGTNLQNITEKLRYIFTADPGRELFYADLEQAESCVVAHLAGDEGYIEAHKHGDVHTYVARLVWPQLPWTGDLAADKEVAVSNRPAWKPDSNYRQLAKAVQHGSNYLMTPHGVARNARLPVAAARESQEAFFEAFPRIRVWQREVVNKIKRTGGVLVTQSGRRFQFLGRLWDEDTYRQAVAAEPQSLVGDILNTALWRIWDELDPDRVWLHAQIHDAVLGSFLIGDRGAVECALELMLIPVDVTDIAGVTRRMTIAAETMAGVNWAKASEKNPGGLKKWA